MTVAAGLGLSKQADVEQYWRYDDISYFELPRAADFLFPLHSQLTSQYPTHPLVTDVVKKAAVFDELASKFEVPPFAVKA